MLTMAVLIGAAAWRATAMMSYERGPLDVFMRLRLLLGFSEGENGPESWPNNPLANAIACPWCLGVWMAAAMYGLWQIEPRLVLVLAAAAAVPLFERVVHRP